jgi:hypothetical protein
MGHWLLRHARDYEEFAAIQQFLTWDFGLVAIRILLKQLLILTAELHIATDVFEE